MDSSELFESDYPPSKCSISPHPLTASLPSVLVNYQSFSLLMDVSDLQGL